MSEDQKMDRFFLRDSQGKLLAMPFGRNLRKTLRGLKPGRYDLERVAGAACVWVGQDEPLRGERLDDVIRRVYAY